MTTARTRRPCRRRVPTSVGKPCGVLHPRVQQVGPEHFGILCFDCAKVRSKFLLADFYGRVLLPPTVVAHRRPALDAAVAQIRDAFAQHQLRDGLVAIERTGRYHRLVQRTFAAAGFETRILHPFVTKQYRQPVKAGKRGRGPFLWPGKQAGTVAITGDASIESQGVRKTKALLCCVRGDS